MVAPFSKFNLGQNLGCFLSQHWKTLFPRGFISKSTERAQVLLKNSARGSQNSPPFEGSASLYVTISGSFKHFQYFNFGKRKTYFLIWSTVFLVESTKIENPLFLYKTTISKANVKANRMVSTKWTYHRERSIASNYFIFLKILLSLRTSYKELI